VPNWLRRKRRCACHLFLAPTHRLLRLHSPQTCRLQEVTNARRVALLEHCLATLRTDLATQKAARDALDAAHRGAQSESDKRKGALEKLMRELSAAADAAALELASEERVIAGQAEYAAGLAAKFARMDADGDGIIDAAEAQAFVGAASAEDVTLWEVAAANAKARVKAARAREASLTEELAQLRRSAKEAEQVLEAERRRTAERRAAQERAVEQFDAYEADLRAC